MSKSTLLLGLVIALTCPSFLFAASKIQTQYNIDWDEVGELFNGIEQKRTERIGIETRAYGMTSDLCYAFEFRAKHQLNLTNPNPFLEAGLIMKNWPHDLRLQQAYWQWLRMDVAAYKSIVGDDTSIISARSRFSRILLESEGYHQAVKDCAQRLGARFGSEKEIESNLRFEIIRNERMKSGSVSLIAFGAIFRGAKILWSTELIPAGLKEQIIQWAVKLKNLLPRSKYTGVTIAGATVAIPTALVIHEHLATIEKNKLALELIMKPEPEELIWDQWSIRRQLMNQMFTDFKELQFRSEKMGRLDCSGPVDLCEKTAKALQLFAKNKDELSDLIIKTEYMLAVEANKSNIPAVETWLVEALMQPEKVEPHILQRMQFLVSAKIVMNLIEIGTR